MLKKIIMIFFVTTNIFPSLSSERLTPEVSSISDQSPASPLPSLFDFENTPSDEPQGTVHGSISPLLNTPKDISASSSSSSSSQKSSSAFASSLLKTQSSSASEGIASGTSTSTSASTLMRKAIACKSKSRSCPIKSTQDDESESDDDTDSSHLKNLNFPPAAALETTEDAASSYSTIENEGESNVSSASRSAASQKFVCTQNGCKRNFNSLRGLRVHLGRKHRTDSTIAEQEAIQNDTSEIEDSNIPLNTKRRKLSASSSASEILHKESQEAPSFICPHCKKNFLNNAGLRSHLRWRHTSSSVSEENEDNESVSQIQSDVPRKNDTKRWYYECTFPDCHARFEEQSLAQAHQQLHYSSSAAAEVDEAPACVKCRNIQAQMTTLQLMIKNTHSQSNSLFENIKLMLKSFQE